MVHLKILMVGAGGIGGYYAAKLAEAGHEVTLTARGEHLNALKLNGLVVDYANRQTFRHSLQAYSHKELVDSCQARDFDVVIVSLKSTATKEVFAELAEWLQAAKTPVLSLQNGVDNEPLIAEIIGEERVIGGLAVRIGGHILKPGHVVAEGAAEIVMGAWPLKEMNDPRSQVVDQLSREFNAAGIPTGVSDNIRYELWRKLLINNGVNPLSALTRLDTRSLTHHPEFRHVVVGMMNETLDAAKADGVDLTREDLEEMFDLISSFNAIKTSMLVDREKGRPLELDSIAGAVLRRCEAMGVEAPYTRLVCALLNHGL